MVILIGTYYNRFEQSYSLDFNSLYRGRIIHFDQHAQSHSEKI
jgi:hypothetical protein